MYLTFFAHKIIFTFTDCECEYSRFLYIITILEIAEVFRDSMVKNNVPLYKYIYHFAERIQEQ